LFILPTNLPRQVFPQALPQRRVLKLQLLASDLHFDKLRGRLLLLLSAFGLIGFCYLVRHKLLLLTDNLPVVTVFRFGLCGGIVACVVVRYRLVRVDGAGLGAAQTLLLNAEAHAIHHLLLFMRPQQSLWVGGLSVALNSRLSQLFVVLLIDHICVNDRPYM
jgi:hypothetical protein